MNNINSPKILLVDDEPDILEFLSYNLEQENYLIETASNGVEALSKVQDFNPDLIVLDIMMPEMDGVEACTEIRKLPNGDNFIIVFLTARNESFTEISALDSGGDDFITKPIKPSVFKSRIKALLRRKNRMDDSVINIIEFDDIMIDVESIRIEKAGLEIALTKKEFHLLKLLISKPGKVFKRNEILNKVWGKDVLVGDRTIDVHIRKLREKLGDHYIKTLKGVGYKFEY